MMDITFTPGFSHEEQLTAWENGTPDEHRLAQWVRGFETAVEEYSDETDEDYLDDYTDGYNDGYGDGLAQGRSETRRDE